MGRQPAFEAQGWGSAAACAQLGKFECDTWHQDVWRTPVSVRVGRGVHRLLPVMAQVLLAFSSCTHPASYPRACAHCMTTGTDTVIGGDTHPLPFTGPTAHLDRRPQPCVPLDTTAPSTATSLSPAVQGPTTQTRGPSNSLHVLLVFLAHSAT